MDGLVLILKFLGLMVVVCGTIIFALHRTLITSTEGAVRRLNEEITKATAKQNELTLKLKEADDELTKRQAEAKALAEKMRTDAEEQSKVEREKIIAKARQEGEEIIAKAQGAKDKIRQELEKEIDIKAVEFSMNILNDILTEKTKGFFDQVLVDEFIENLKNTDMSKLSPNVTSVDVVTLNPLQESAKTRLIAIVKEKLNRNISLNATIDPNLGGGVVLKFGSMALDGSIKYLIRESATAQVAKVEAGRT